MHCEIRTIASSRNIVVDGLEAKDQVDVDSIHFHSFAIFQIGNRNSTYTMGSHYRLVLRIAILGGLNLCQIPVRKQFNFQSLIFHPLT